MRHWRYDTLSMDAKLLASDAKPRRVRRKHARPQELLAVALALFEEKGYAATRLEDVATRAGVCKGTLYRYFTNKEELFRSVICDNLASTAGVVEVNAAAHGGHSAEMLKSLLREWWTRLNSGKFSVIMRLMAVESGNFPELDMVFAGELKRSTRVINDVIACGVERGHFSATTVTVTTQVIVGAIMMLAMGRTSFYRDSVVDPHASIDCFISLLLSGLQSRGIDDAVARAGVPLLLQSSASPDAAVPLSPMLASGI